MKKIVSVIVAGVLALVVVACGSTTPAAQTSFKATLSGASEVPAVTTTATGDASVTLVGNKMTLTGSYKGLSGAATAAHIHGPAAEGANAGVVVTLVFTESATAGTGTLAVTADLTDAQITDLRAGQYYVNVHTTANKGGEIRGQLK